jgi:hypothetical protein
VVKDDFGVEKVVFAKTQSDVSITSVVRLLNLDFSIYYDLDGDGIADIIGCGENQSSGQVKCQTINTATKTVMVHFNILSPSYITRAYLTLSDFNADGSYDGLGWHQGSLTELLNARSKSGQGIGGCGQFLAIPAGTGHDSDLYIFLLNLYE